VGMRPGSSLNMQKPFNDYFNSRTVLVTGHTGFKGSWLCAWLSSLGAEVHGYALAPPSTPGLFRQANLESKLASHTIADIRCYDSLLDVMQRVRPEVVFHLAAQPLVLTSYEQPLNTLDTNIMGTANLLEAVRQVDSVRVCQIITSDKCYENREWAYGYRETDPMGGHDPYSSSKACAELVTAAYRNSFFTGAQRHPVSIATVRAGNVIGGGDWAENRIVPDCIRALADGKRIDIRRPHAIRPWQHVLDPLSGYLMLAARQAIDPDTYSVPWNFGPSSGGAKSVQELVQELIHCWGSGHFLAQEDSAQKHEAGFLQLDCTKSNMLLNWSPVLSFSESVAWSAHWYKSVLQQPSLADCCMSEQISDYCQLAASSGQHWAIREAA